MAQDPCREFIQHFQITILNLLKNNSKFFGISNPNSESGFLFWARQKYFESPKIPRIENIEEAQVSNSRNFLENHEIPGIQDFFAIPGILDFFAIGL